MKNIYLAVPYSHENVLVEWERYYASLKAQADIRNQGFRVYNPIGHWHMVTKRHKLPTNWEFWRKENDFWVSWADETHVLQLPGWDESAGVAHEMRYTHNQGKPVVYIRV